ncbi:MAG: alkylation response protein AidB-like acyl-CoA dehydrogenase [Myxococcota bacterium]|jgi:alkylation response protein AidB-like acyl-CoA dehydrogenase
MKIEFTPDQLAMQKELRAYFDELITPAMQDELDRGGEGGGPEFRKTMRQLGTDGWIGLSWPKELGGKEMTAMEQYIFTEEVMRTGFPYPFLTTEAVGPVINEHATDEMKDAVVKPLLRGEVVIAIGYSEPSAGTDLASLTTRADRDGDDWVINGQKIWTSLADFSDYIWLAARTDPDSKKHRGLSMLLVPNDTEGLTISPIWTLGVRTNAVYFDNVRVPAASLIGGEGNGWGLITGQLNRERLSLVNHGSADNLYRKVASWAASTTYADGTRVIDQAWVQTNLAKVKTGLEALKLVCWKQAWAMTEGSLQMADASVAKVFGTEYFLEHYRLLGEIMGQAGTLVQGSPGAILKGRLEHMYRVGSILTFGGGTNEVQRDIIAAAGLGMPRSR